MRKSGIQLSAPAAAAVLGAVLLSFSACASLPAPAPAPSPPAPGPAPASRPDPRPKEFAKLATVEECHIRAWCSTLTTPRVRSIFTRR